MCSVEYFELYLLKISIFGPEIDVFTDLGPEVGIRSSFSHFIVGKYMVRS